MAEVAVKVTAYGRLVGWAKFLFALIERGLLVGALQFAFNQLSDPTPTSRAAALATLTVGLLYLAGYLTLVLWAVSAAAKQVNPFLEKLSAGPELTAKFFVFCISTVIAGGITWAMVTTVNVLVDHLARLAG